MTYSVHTKYDISTPVKTDDGRIGVIVAIRTCHRKGFAGMRRTSYTYLVSLATNDRSTDVQEYAETRLTPMEQR